MVGESGKQARSQHRIAGFQNSLLRQKKKKIKKSPYWAVPSVDRCTCRPACGM